MDANNPTPEYEGYSDAFKRAVKHTLESEGVFSSHSWDPGGATKYGITAALGRQYNVSNIRDLTVEHATYIYHAEFWWKLDLDDIASVSWRVAAEVFDTAVNCGSVRAVKIVQEALLVVFKESIAVDGKLGPRTRATLKRVAAKYETQLVAALNGFQFSYYLWLLRNRHSAADKAIKGWMRRLETPLS